MAKTYDERNHFYTILKNWDEHPELDGMDRYLLMTINNLSFKHGYCYASYATLGKLIGLSGEQARRRDNGYLVDTREPHTKIIVCAGADEDTYHRIMGLTIH